MDGGSKPGPSLPAQWGYSARIDNLPTARSPDFGEPRVTRETPPDALKDDAKRKAPPKEDGKDKPEQQEGDAASKPPMSRRKKLLYGLIGVLVLAALVIAGVLYWLNSRHYESTDDAFIDGNISQIASRVAGRVTSIAFADNQQVKAGQLLIELDPRDFQVKLDQAVSQRTQAAAQLDQARAQLGVQQANLDQSNANVRVTEADLQQAQTDFARYRSIDPKAIAKQQLDTASSAVRSAQARLDANRQAVAGVRAQIEAQRAAIAAADATLQQAEVGVENAKLQLSYTNVVAPADGQVTKRTVELGNYVNPGQSLVAVVRNEMWVTANFKETQLAAMQPGQYVRVQVDACPDFDITARVGSFQAGTGSVFSSLPAENATGNYVKVVQRLPVRINFEKQDLSRCRMAPGMSVAPRVTVR